MSRATLVDALALVVFFTLVAAATEIVVAGLSPNQVLVTRMATLPILLVAGRPYGLWRDAILDLAGARRRGRVRMLVVDTAAFLSFQVPLYAGVLALAGATTQQAFAALGSATVGMLLLSRPFGVFLDWARRRAGVAPPQPL